MTLPTSTTLEMLEAHTRRLEIDLAKSKQHRNSHLPIGKVPDEVLCNVFVELWKPSHSCLPFGVLAGQVCHRWRTVVYGNPLLWADIRVCGDTEFTLADHLIKSSKGVPISLKINRPDGHCLPTMALLEETVKIASTRIRTLSIVGTADTLSTLLKGPFNNPHSRLETLEVTGIDDDSMTFRTGLDLISAPEIQRIKLGHGAGKIILVVPWKSTLFATCANLTHLRAVHTPKAGSVQDLKDVLQAAPQLQELHLIFDRPPWQPHTGPFDLGEWNTEHDEIRVRMPRLRVLHLQSRREWTPAAALLDGMQLKLGSLESLSLVPAEADYLRRSTISEWWPALRNACVEGEVCAPEVLHLLSGREGSIEAWKETPDASAKVPGLPWVLQGVEDAGLAGDDLGRPGDAAGGSDQVERAPWLSFYISPSFIFADWSNYHTVWSFSDLKVLEFGEGCPRELWTNLDREAPQLEVIIVKSDRASRDFYPVFCNLVKQGTGQRFPELKKVSLRCPICFQRRPWSPYGDEGRWVKGRSTESSFQLPPWYYQPIDVLSLSSISAPFRHRTERRRREEAEFMLDFADILWERMKRGVLGGNDVGRKDSMLETLEFIGFEHWDVHNEVKQIILDSGVAQEVVIIP